MDKKHLIYISDFNMGGANSAEQGVTRSGYANIGMELCRRLSTTNEIKVLGLGYTGQEYWEEFSIIPCATIQDITGNMNNLKFLWNVDAVIVALDVHYFQEQIFPAAKKLELKYICITPLESDPLCITWANLLNQMDKVFFISQFGADEAIKAGVNAEHIEIGIDTKSWRLRTEEEYNQIRSTLGFEPDEFVVLTVADNQERKNLARGMEIIAGLKKQGVRAKHLLVTREYSDVGWKLYDAAYELGISSDLRVFRTGMPFADLYVLYCAADAYLCASKGEGLGLPIMESMCVGIPVVANRTGAIPELLANHRGWIVDYDCWYIDPFGNQNRYFMSIEEGVKALLDVRYEKILAGEENEVIKRTKSARAYMETKSWDKPAAQIQAAIETIFEKK